MQIEELAYQASQTLASHVVLSNGMSVPYEQIDAIDGFEKLVTFTSRNFPHYIVHFKSDMETKDESGKTQNYSRLEVEDHRIYLALPKEFNDPFECLPGVDGELWTRSLFLEYVSTIFKANNLDIPDFSSTHIQDLPSLVTRAVEMLTGGKNDTDYEHIGNVKDEKLAPVRHITQLLMHSKEKRTHILLTDLQNVANLIFQQEVGACSNMVRISCFTTDYLNDHMWAHYANGYKGFCIIYETFSVDEKGDPQFADFSKQLYPVIYSARRFDLSKVLTDMTFSHFDEADTTAFFARLALTKSLSWAQEREWRLIIPTNSNVLVDQSYLPMPRPKLVVAGPEMDGQKCNSLHELCSRENISFLKATKRSDTFGLVTKECNGCNIT